jgi:hypothetical protein
LLSPSLWNLSLGRTQQGVLYQPKRSQCREDIPYAESSGERKGRRQNENVAQYPQPRLFLFENYAFGTTCTSIVVQHALSHPNSVNVLWRYWHIAPVRRNGNQVEDESETKQDNSWDAAVDPKSEKNHHVGNDQDPTA